MDWRRGPDTHDDSSGAWNEERRWGTKLVSLTLYSPPGPIHIYIKISSSIVYIVILPVVWVHASTMIDQ